MTQKVNLYPNREQSLVRVKTRLRLAVAALRGWAVVSGVEIHGTLSVDGPCLIANVRTHPPAEPSHDASASPQPVARGASMTRCRGGKVA